MAKLLLYLFALAGIVSLSWELKIPLSLMKKIGKLTEPEDFARFFERSIGSNETTEVDSNRTLIGGRAIKRTRAYVDVAKHDPCSPRLTTVMIPQDDDPSLLYWPLCTKIKRCGGCCSTDAYECTATKTSYVYVNVLMSRYRHEGSDGFANAGTLPIPMIQHDECEPQCRVKKHHCTAYQVYDDNDCSCKCTAKVTNCPADQRWKPSLCRCACNVVKECGDSSLKFSPTTCRCEFRDIVSNVDLDKINASVLQKNLGGVKKVDGKTRKTIPISQTGNDGGKTGSNKIAEPHVVKVAVQHKVEKDTKPEAKKVDCSKKDCPPFWEGFETQSGTCICKMSFL